MCFELSTIKDTGKKGNEFTFEKESDELKKPEPKATKDEEAITAELLIDWLDEIELAMAALPEGDQSLVGAKLVEMASAYIDAGKSVRDRKRLAA
jgi:hypothetical protein